MSFSECCEEIPGRDALLRVREGETTTDAEDRVPINLKEPAEDAGTEGS